MIRVYTHWEDLNKAPYRIFSNELTFKAFNRRPEIYTEYVREVMLRLDQAVLVDIHTRMIKTPSGITDVESLSLGCKTVINAICCIKLKNTPAVINANDCGPKALLELFKVADNQSISLVLMHTQIPKELYWRFKVNNNQELVDCFDLQYHIMGIS